MIDSQVFLRHTPEELAQGLAFKLIGLVDQEPQRTFSHLETRLVTYFCSCKLYIMGIGRAGSEILRTINILRILINKNFHSFGILYVYNLQDFWGRSMFRATVPRSEILETINILKFLIIKFA